MKKLWTDKQTKQNSLVNDYCFSEGVKLDGALVLHDVYGSIAHAEMLKKMKIINDQEYKKLKKTLIKIIKLHDEGNFMLKAEDEDIHTKIENYLTDKLGELGKKIHTFRSRNDQVLVDLRLYTKEQLFNTVKNLIDTAVEFLSFAKKYEFVPMPGYTHMQKAMPSSVGMWSASFSEQLIDLLIVVKSVYEINDQSPLGSAAAYGVSLPINREITAKKLGFSKVQNNSLYCQVSRPTFHLATLQVLTQIMLVASRFASDLLLFTTAEFDFFAVDESICTGSSIMPQKKNLDLMEYIRAKTHTVIGDEFKVATMAAGLPSGYNGDFGETKGPLMESFSIVIQTLKVLKIAIKEINPKIDNLKKACTKELYATHMAYEKVVKGIPFRSAYLQVKKSLGNIPLPEPVEFLKKSTHVGGTGNLELKRLKNQLIQKEKEWKQIKNNYKKVINYLLDLSYEK